ncbi:MAG: enoyl-CoA hydratase/isomerase family protein [Burkholderiaceae bacterium]|nr:enoyl-CoA hydratase/isomerase family protein [Burkholderiaceae bacterium]
MTCFETILYERADAIAWITLNRPAVLNAYSVRMRDELHEIVQAIRDDDEVRAVVVKGAGEKAFCGGADLSEFLTAPSVIEARRIRALRDLWGALRSLQQPLIAALHGYVLGSGMEIALFCDLRIASEDVVFGLPEIGLGILPGAGGTQTVPRAIGLSRSLDMLLTNRRMDATEALSAGLVNRVVPRDALIAAALGVARRIASFDPMIVCDAKRAVREGLDLSLEQGLKLEQRLVARARRTTGSSRTN